MTGAERREQLIEIARGAVRRAGVRRHLVEEIAARAGRVQTGRLRALRRQGRPLRRRRRPRGAAPARQHARRHSSRRHPRVLLERAAFALLDYIEQLAGRLPHPGPRLADRLGESGSFVSIIGDIATRVEHILGDEFETPRLRPEARRCMPRCSSAWSPRPASGGSTYAAREAGRRRPPGQPRLERPVRAREGAPAGEHVGQPVGESASSRQLTADPWRPVIRPFRRRPELHRRDRAFEELHTVAEAGSTVGAGGSRGTCRRASTGKPRADARLRPRDHRRGARDAPSARGRTAPRLRHGVRRRSRRRRRTRGTRTAATGERGRLADFDEPQRSA